MSQTNLEIGRITTEDVRAVVVKGYLFPSVVQRVASELTEPPNRLERMRLVRDQLSHLVAEMSLTTQDAIETEVTRFEIGAAPTATLVNERRERFFFSRNGE